LLVPPKDAAALAEAIIYLIKDPNLRRRLGKAARERVVAHFSDSAINQAMLDIYREVKTNTY
jgi:glycosyltransferase involved in cell wall biosynthesis